MHGDFGNAVNEYFVKEFRRIYDERKVRIGRLDTPEAVLEYASAVRQRIREVFDLEKIPRTPLNCEIVSEHDFRSYTLKNLIFESRPGYHVTANLYLPAGTTAPVPAVLHLCGHNHDGKACANGVSLNVGFAANGIAVLAIDPVCQGERYQHFMEDEKDLCGAHNMIGKELILFGEHFAAWRAWDALRAADLLCTLPEIDHTRLMLTGCSGGGTMTTWVNALDDRFIAAAPSCAVTRWRRTVENELPVDAEQMPRFLAGEGLDMADFLIASLPRPILVSGEENDFFDKRGQQEVGRELEYLSGILDAPLKSTFFTGPDGHGLRAEQREAIRKFFFAAAGVEPRGIPEDAIPRPEEHEKLAAPGGEVLNIPGERSVMKVASDICAEVIAARKTLDRKTLAGALKSCLALPEDIPVPDDYRRLPPRPHGEKQCFNRYLIENKERILGVIYAMTGVCDYQLPRCREAVLYLPDGNCCEIADLPAEYREEKTVFGIDTFGIGELAPTSCGINSRDFTAFYGASWHFSGLAAMLGKSFPGLQMEGVLSAIKLLRANGTERLTVIGRGCGAVLAAYTALLAEDMVSRTVLLDAPGSFAGLVGTYNMRSFAEMVPDILKYTDWTDIAVSVNAEIR